MGQIIESRILKFFATERAAELKFFSPLCFLIAFYLGIGATRRVYFTLWAMDLLLSYLSSMLKCSSILVMLSVLNCWVSYGWILSELLKEPKAVCGVSLPFIGELHSEKAVILSWMSASSSLMSCCFRSLWNLSELSRQQNYSEDIIIPSGVLYAVFR